VAPLTPQGYRQKFANSEIVNTFNSKGKISSTITVFGINYALKLYASANYPKDSYKFGYGLSIGQQQ